MLLLDHGDLRRLLSPYLASRQGRRGRRPLRGVRGADPCRSGRANIFQFNLIILCENDQIEARDDQIAGGYHPPAIFSAHRKRPVGATCGRPPSRH